MEMENDNRREGDERPIHHDEKLHLHLSPDQGEPFRFLPKHGDPYCIGEWASQHFVKTIAYWPIYSSIVSTLILVIIVWHPLGLGE